MVQSCSLSSSSVLRGGGGWVRLGRTARRSAQARPRVRAPAGGVPLQGLPRAGEAAGAARPPGRVRLPQRELRALRTARAEVHHAGPPPAVHAGAGAVPPLVWQGRHRTVRAGYHPRP
eukprot:200642-Pyramimonas_sp.AAC.1